MCDNGTIYYRCSECMWESHETANPDMKPDECPDCHGTNFEQLDLEDEQG